MIERASPEQRLEEAEATLDALRHGEVDAIVGREQVMLVRLRESEEAVRAGEQRFRTLVGSIDQGFCVVEVLFDKDVKPVDYRFLEVNAAFEARTGLRNVLGRRMRELVPDIETAWVEAYGKVALTGQAVRFESVSKSMGRVYDVHAFRIDAPSDRRVGILFDDITARTQADSALRVSRQILSTIVSHIPAAVALIRGSDLRLQLINPAYQAIAPGKDMLGLTLNELWAETGADFDAVCRQVLETGEPHVVEDDPVNISRRPGGPVEQAYFSWSMHRVRLPGEEGWGLLNVAWETTRRKESEQALRRSEERWNAAIENFGEGAIIASEDEHVIYRNPAARRIHGFAAGENGLGPLVAMRDRFELWTADGTRRLEMDEWPIRRVKRGEPVNGLELRLRRIDQGWDRIVSYSGSMVETPSGERLVFISVYDLTELRRAEEALRASEERFRQLADSMPQLVWTAYPDGVVNYVNSQTSRYEGFTRNPDGTWAWHPVLHPDDVERTSQTWQAALKSGKVYECEHRVRRSDGKFRWHLSRARRVTSPAGTLWFGTATDIHDLKLAEEALRDADRRKDEFLAVLAHELRNPLAPLRTGLELLRRSQAGSTVAGEARAMMERQVLQMVRLIDDLLDTSRIARGKFDLRKQAMDIVEAVRGALETSRPLMQMGGHRVDVQLPDGPLMVEGDPVRVAQVLTNLLNNAARYTPSGGHIVTRAAREGASIVIEVEDNGVGIPEEMLDRVFEPFLQIENAAMGGRAGGLGLGLTLARSIVELHGGSIVARRRSDGHGTCFAVTLPALNGAAPATDASPCRPDRIIGRALRVLVVDDNRDAAQTLATLLGLMQLDVRVANEGGEALRLAELHRPELVLLDIGMPRMDGYEVARRLRSLPCTATARIVALSGYGQDSDKRRSAAAGFDDHLVKPVDPERLEEVVESLTRP
jgi:PAS domain S-box-containing protein